MPSLYHLFWNMQGSLFCLFAVSAYSWLPTGMSSRRERPLLKCGSSYFRIDFAMCARCKILTIQAESKTQLITLRLWSSFKAMCERQHCIAKTLVLRSNLEGYEVCVCKIGLRVPTARWFRIWLEEISVAEILTCAWSGIHFRWVYVRPWRLNQSACHYELVDYHCSVQVHTNLSWLANLLCGALTSALPRP